jgi:hypothetical protein
MRIHIGYIRPRGRYQGAFQLDLDVTPNDTVRSLKERVLELEHIPLNLQTLFYRQRELRNDQTLADYNVVEGASILLSHVRCEPS